MPPACPMPRVPPELSVKLPLSVLGMMLPSINNVAVLFTVKLMAF